MSPRKSPKKKVKTILVTNNDKNTKIICDRSHEKEALKKSNQLQNGLDTINGTEQNGNEEITTDEDEPLSPFKNKSIITDNYFMAQSTRSKTSKNSFAKLLQNFDLSENRIKDIIDEHFVEEREQLMESYVNNKSLEKWFHLLKYSYTRFEILIEILFEFYCL